MNPKPAYKNVFTFSTFYNNPQNKRKMFTSKPLLRTVCDQWASVLCPLYQIWAVRDTQPSPGWGLQTTCLASFPFFFLTWLLTSYMHSGPKLLRKLLLKPSGSVVSSGFSYQFWVQSAGILVSHFSEQSQGHSIVQLLRMAHTAEQRGLMSLLWALQAMSVYTGHHTRPKEEEAGLWGRFRRSCGQ